jgi:selenocysteine lyase/cysteine desulfurase
MILFQRWQGRKETLIVSMSAASNVTGILADTETVSQLAHKYGAFVIWDYATAGKNTNSSSG